MAGFRTLLALVALASSAHDACATCSAMTGQTTNGFWTDDHDASSLCTITIPPPGQGACAHGIRLAFSGFDTQLAQDYVYIFQGDGSSVDCQGPDSSCADRRNALYALTGTCNVVGESLEIEKRIDGSDNWGTTHVTYERVDRGMFCDADDVANNGCEIPPAGGMVATHGGSATADQSRRDAFMLTTDGGTGMPDDGRLHLVSATEGSHNGAGFTMYWSCREICPAGQGTVLQDNYLWESCDDCRNGQYDAGDTSYDFRKDACKNCQAGKRSSDDRTWCEACPAGKYRDPDEDVLCLSCPDGKNSAAGASECIDELNKLSSSSRATLSEVLAFGVMMLAAALV